MEEKYITLKDDTRIFTASSLGKFQKTIIFVHGGPGNGMWDALPMLEKLSGQYNVLAFDERGVNKSDAVTDGFTSEMLIDDIEDIREQFNLGNVCLIGHSYGGHLLLRYALKYPEHAEKCVFLCPSFNFIDSLHTVVEQACRDLDGTDYSDLDELKRKLDDNTFESVLSALMMIPEKEQFVVYGYDKIPGDVMEELGRRAPSEAEILKSSAHQQAVFSEDEIRKDYTERLSELSCPALLIVGSEDPVCSPWQIKRFSEAVRDCTVRIISGSGHFPYSDSVDATVSAISAFAG